ncbi:hypothetical protein HanLR1_Chr13g0487381 [Helianthus annuus]|nr:hypothetical protein HanLR1_Chr13g0487381 [Helianthus annuus]
MSKRRLLEQNGAKMEHSSKLPDMARPCQPHARPCQANQHQHSHQHYQSTSTAIENQRPARQCQPQARP